MSDSGAGRGGLEEGDEYLLKMQISQYPLLF